MEVIKKAINDFLFHTEARRDEIMVVIGRDLETELLKMNVGIGIKECKTIYGVEILVSDRIEGELFGICFKECKEHIDDHIDDMMGPEWIQCRLCKHPLSTILADGDDVKCLWCGDVNDLDDIKGEC